MPLDGTLPPTRRLERDESRSRRLSEALAVGLLFLAGTLVADEPRFQSVGKNAGLSHMSISALEQDHQGFLWVGTADGLHRFDGRESRIWRHQEDDPESIVSSLVQAILEDRAGSLWVGTSRGLDRFDRKQGRFIHVDGGIPGMSVGHLFEDTSGSLWVGMLTGGLSRLSEGEQLEIVHFLPGGSNSLAEGDVAGIEQDKDGFIWVLTLQWGASPPVLNRIDPDTGQVRQYRAPDGWDRCGGFVIDSSGHFWLNVAGVGAFDPVQAAFHGPLFDPVHPVLSKPYLASTGGVWLPVQGGVHLFDPARGDLSTYRLEASNDFLAELSGPVLEDSTGTLWIGSRGGLFKWDPSRKPFRSWRSREEDASSLGGSQVSAIHQDRRGTIWVGAFGGGLSRLDDKGEHFQRYRNDPVNPASLCHDIIWDIAEDRTGMIWLGTEDGLCRLEPASGRFEAIRDHQLDLPHATGHTERITSIVEDKQGKLWLGSSFGVLRFDPESGSSIRLDLASDDKPKVDVNHLLLDGRQLWIASGSVGRSGLFLIDIDADFPPDPLPTPLGPELDGDGILDIHLDRAGILWLATSSGLVRYDPNPHSFSILTTKEGLPGSLVYSVLEDSDGRLWLGTNRGLSRFDPREQGPARFRNYSPEDGLGTLEFNRHATLAASDGRFFFGGMEGLTAFRPEEVVDNPNVPPLAITEVRVWGQDGARSVEPFGLDRLNLPHDQTTVSFRFAALNFNNAERNRFKYRLEGHESEWVESGTHGIARYAHLPPGRYVFRVQGSNNDGVWNEVGISLPVRVAPSFWRSWWGRGLLAVLLVTALAAFHRYRVARLVEMERLRWRIADDLHDDLSSDLSGIALAAALLRQNSPQDQRNEERLADIESVSRGLVERLRDVVWYVNPEHDTPDALVRRMRDVATRLIPDVQCRIDSELSTPGWVLDMPTRRHLFLIFKEALHNIARHAQAPAVRIQLREADGRLVLTIRDLGVGFDPAKVDSGLGLTSMRRRAENMGAKLHLSSRPGEGTNLELEMTRTRGGWRQLPVLRWVLGVFDR